MNENGKLENRLNYIEKICRRYKETPGFPKNVIMEHLIKVAKGEEKIK